MMRVSRLLVFSLLATTLLRCSSKPPESSPAEMSEVGGPAPMAITEPDDSSPTVSRPTPTPQAVREALGSDPWKDLAAAIRTQNDDEIRARAEGLLARLPTDDRALNALAMVAYRKGQHDYAAYLLGKGLQAHPQRSELHSNLGLVMLAQDEKPAALKSFRRALELNSNDGLAAANAGAIYVAEKDYNKAIVTLEIAYRQGVRDAKSLNNYGIALVGTGKADRARSIYEEGLKDTNNHRELMLNYAIVLVDHLNQPKEGLEVINRLKFLGPPPESRERLARLEERARAGVK